RDRRPRETPPTAPNRTVRRRRVAPTVAAARRRDAEQQSTTRQRRTHRTAPRHQAVSRGPPADRSACQPSQGLSRGSEDMGHFKSNTRDIEFNLFEDLKVQEPMSQGAWGDLDEDTARTMISEVAKLAEGPLGEAYADADRNPPTFDPETHSVTLPE